MQQGCIRREEKAPQKRPQERFDRQLEEVAKAVAGGYCRLQNNAIAAGTCHQRDSSWA